MLHTHAETQEQEPQITRLYLSCMFKIQYTEANKTESSNMTYPLSFYLPALCADVVRDKSSCDV